MKNIARIFLVFIALAITAAAGEAVKMVIEIVGKGDVTMDGSRCALAAVEGALKEKKAAAPEIVVLIVAREDGDLATVTGVLDACRKAGIQQVRVQSK